MGETFLDRHGIKSGIKLNDVIEDFRYVYKGQTIKAGDLVNYINGVAGKTDLGTSSSKTLSTTQYSGQVLSAVQLDENRVFIAHSYGSSYYLYGIVCRIEGNTITHGTDTGLYISQYGGARVSAVLLQNGDVFIAHSRESAYRLTGTVCKINDMEITVTVKATQLATMQDTGRTISTCVLPNGNVFIAHNYGNNTQYHLYGIVVTISGTTITAGTDTALVSSTNNAGTTISTCLLPNGNVFIAHSREGNNYLYSMVVSISGTTITYGTDTQLSSSVSTAKHISACLLPNGNVFIAYSYGGSDYLYGIVCAVSGTTITKGTNTELLSSKDTGNNMSTVLLPNGNVLIVHSYNTSSTYYYLYGMIVSFEGTTITAVTDTSLVLARAGGASSPLLLGNGTIFLPYCGYTNDYLNAQIFAIDDNNVPTNNIVITEYEQQVTPAIEPPFNAVALSSGVGGTDTEHNEQVKIARVYKEVVKTDNIFPINWTKVSVTEYKAVDGSVLTASNASDNTNTLQYAIDGNEANHWSTGSTLASAWLKIKLPKAVVINKMKMKVQSSYLGVYKNTIIQGSNDDNVWDDLCTTGWQGSLEEIVLNNAEAYQYYRIYMTSGEAAYFHVFEWQVSEYVEVIQ